MALEIGRAALLLYCCYSFVVAPMIATQQQERQRQGLIRVAFAGFAAGIAICLLLTVHLHSSLDTYIHHVDETAVHQSSPLRTQQQEVQDKQHGTPTTEDEGISACLLVNDENPRLPEWISYHYQTLPLRALIIAIDPASRSLPNDIILQWLDELPNVYIRPWSEKR